MTRNENTGLWSSYLLSTKYLKFHTGFCLHHDFVQERHCSVFTAQKQPPEVLCKKDVLNNFAKFTVKHLYWCLFFNKVAQAYNVIKKRLQHRCFPVKFAKFLRTPMLKNICKRLVLIAYRKRYESVCLV